MKADSQRGIEGAQACPFLGDHLDRFKGVGALHDPLMDEGGEVRVAALRSGPHVVGAAGAVHCHELLALCRAFGN